MEAERRADAVLVIAEMNGLQWGMIIGFPAVIIVAGLLMVPMFWYRSKGRHRR